MPAFYRELVSYFMCNGKTQTIYDNIMDKAVRRVIIDSTGSKQTLNLQLFHSRHVFRMMKMLFPPLQNCVRQGAFDSERINTNVYSIIGV
jgi:hypothetical protein